MYCEWNENRNGLIDALSELETMFGEIARAARKPTNRSVWTAGTGCDDIKQTPNGCYEITMKREEPSKCSNLLDDIEQIIFNDPATIVTFKDGTKVCVKACKTDKFSKETGLIYALVKRLYANDTDENGYLKSRGLGEKISKLVEGAIDQKKIEADRKAKRDAKKAKKSEEKKEDIAPGQE